MFPWPGLSYGLSYAVGIRKPFQVINILPPSPVYKLDGFRRAAANMAPWDKPGLFLLYWAMDVSGGERLGKGVVFSFTLIFREAGTRNIRGSGHKKDGRFFKGKERGGYAQIVDKAC